MKVHTNDTVGIKEKPFKCQKCNKSFDYRSYLARHIQIHNY